MWLGEINKRDQEEFDRLWRCDKDTDGGNGAGAFGSVREAEAG